MNRGTIGVAAVQSVRAEYHNANVFVLIALVVLPTWAVTQALVSLDLSTAKATAFVSWIDVIALAAAAVALLILRTSIRTDALARRSAIVIAALVVSEAVLRVGAIDPLRPSGWTLGVHSIIAVVGCTVIVPMLLSGAGGEASKAGRGLAILVAAGAAASGDAVSGLFDDAVSVSVVARAIRLGALLALLLFAYLELHDQALTERLQARVAEDRATNTTETIIRAVTAHDCLVHDLRSGLLAVQGGLRITTPSADSADLLHSIRLEVERLRSVLEGSATNAVARSFDVVDALRPMIELKLAAGERIGFHVDGEVWGRGRSFLVVQAVHNLVQNALEHGGGDVDVFVEQNGSMSTVRVCDRGPGLGWVGDDEIFEQGVTTGSGSGLGLFIARAFVALDGGHVSAAPREGGGSVFSLSFPAAQPDQPPRVAGTESVESVEGEERTRVS